MKVYKPPASDARLRAMCNQLVAADESDDDDWFFEIRDSTKHLRHEDRLRLQEMLNQRSEQPCD